MHRSRRQVVCSLVLAVILAFGNAHGAPLDKKSYVRHAVEMGVIVFDVNWGRQWNCAGNDNAQLVSLRFENVSLQIESHDKYTEIKLKTPSRLFVNPVFRNYGFLVRPGTYALTEWSIKVAKTASDIHYMKAGRDELVEGHTFLGGSVEVNAGEIIYIGNFFLDCYYSPIPWRYYSEGRENFQSQVAEYQSTFGFLKDKEIIYRLLDTENYGGKYVLPE